MRAQARRIEPLVQAMTVEVERQDRQLDPAAIRQGGIGKPARGVQMRVFEQILGPRDRRIGQTRALGERDDPNYRGRSPDYSARQ